MTTPAFWTRLRRRMTPSRRRPRATYGAAPANPAGDRFIRCTSIAAVVVVALIAAYISYGHAYELVHSHGETGAAARLAPVTVDGMIVASSMVLLQAARYRQRAPWLAHACLWAGIVATAGANAAHGSGHGRIGVLVSVWPAVALIGSYELLMKVIRAGAARIGVPAEPADVHHDAPPENQCSHGVAQTVQEAVQEAYLHGRDCLSAEPSQRQLSDRFSVDRRKVAQLVREVAPDAWPQPAQGAAGRGDGAPVSAASNGSAPALDGAGGR